MLEEIKISGRYCSSKSVKTLISDGAKRIFISASGITGCNYGNLAETPLLPNNNTEEVYFEYDKPYLEFAEYDKDFYLLTHWFKKNAVGATRYQGRVMNYANQKKFESTIPCSRNRLNEFLDDLKNNNEAFYILNYDGYSLRLLFGKNPALNTFTPDFNLPSDEEVEEYNFSQAEDKGIIHKVVGDDTGNKVNDTYYKPISEIRNVQLFDHSVARDYPLYFVYANQGELSLQTVSITMVKQDKFMVKITPNKLISNMNVINQQCYYDDSPLIGNFSYAKKF